MVDPDVHTSETAAFLVYLSAIQAQDALEHSV
jgi:hypothetical protein